MKNVKYLLLFLLVFEVLFCQGIFKSEAITPVPTLEVSGIFERIDETEEPHQIVLNVNGNEVSGPIRQMCTFQEEKGNYIERDLFVQRYLKRIITVELTEESGEVIACRVGS